MFIEKLNSYLQEEICVPEKFCIYKYLRKIYFQSQKYWKFSEVMLNLKQEKVSSKHKNMNLCGPYIFI